MKRTMLLLSLALSLGSLKLNAATTNKWDWIAGTYWYVPTKNLPAYTYSPLNNSLMTISDQTVFYIAGSANGYFWGNVVGQLGSNSPSCQSLVGSVTPEGKVYLNFNSLPYTPGAAPTIGIGSMVKKGRQWTMANQMSTGSSSLQVGHWAYMVLTKSGDASWNSLPGVNMSVSSFLAQCPDNTPSTQ